MEALPKNELLEMIRAVKNMDQLEYINSVLLKEERMYNAYDLKDFRDLIARMILILQICEN